MPDLVPVHGGLDAPVSRIVPLSRRSQFYSDVADLPKIEVTRADLSTGGSGRWPSRPATRCTARTSTRWWPASSASPGEGFFTGVVLNAAGRRAQGRRRAGRRAHALLPQAARRQLLGQGDKDEKLWESVGYDLNESSS
jgi:hypothetical protein